MAPIGLLSAVYLSPETASLWYLTAEQWEVCVVGEGKEDRGRRDEERLKAMGNPKEEKNSIPKYSVQSH